MVILKPREARKELANLKTLVERDALPGGRRPSS
jgi:hypothetical protein